MRLASFEVDLTPPAGEAIAYGINRRTASPIYLRGVVLDDGRTRVVLAAAEIIGLYGGAYAQWRGCVARASRTPLRHVFLHSVHQHDSLRPFSPRLRASLRGREDPLKPSAAFQAELLRRLDAGLRRAVRPSNWRTVRALASAERRLAGLASNRRLMGADGKVCAMRWSMTTAPALQRHPVGRIDPLLRTLGFLGSGGRLLGALHFYATHPMGAYRRNRVCADIPGVALDYLRRRTRGTGFQVYFTGCAADITFGKYTFPTKAQNLKILGRRLGEGLCANVRALVPRAAGRLALRFGRLRVPLDARRFVARALAARLKRAGTFTEAAECARKLELVRGWRTFGAPELARLDLGPGVTFLSLPAESAIEYQLYAQALAPEKFLAVAAYADGSLGYLPTARMYAEGGYEPGASFTTPALEPAYKRALARLLAE